MQPDSPLDTDALVLVPLGGNHDICFIQDKDFDFLGINELQLGAPVQDSARGANDDLLCYLLPTFHWEEMRSRPALSRRTKSFLFPPETM